MSTAVQSEPHRIILPDAPTLSDNAHGIGLLVVEQRSVTPLGPKIVYANAELARLSGFELENLIGSPLGLLYDRNDLPALISKLPLIAARTHHCYMDRILQRNGGSRLPCHWTIRSTNRDGEPRGYFALTVRPLAAVDASAALAQTGASAPLSNEAPAASAQAVSAERAARNYEAARNESISLAAAGVAHDFKNALQTIKMNLELASMASPEDGRLKTHLQEAHLALGDAEMLARQMLAFTRGEASRRRPLHLGRLLERASKLCSAGSGIRCRLSQNQNLRSVEGDEVRLYQVLHNLVINARQAMPNGGTIDIIADNVDFDRDNAYEMPPGHYVVVSVQDKGCGIPKDALERIFDPSYTTKADGTGIGLASCLSIVQEHRGAIRVASKVGVGTEFLVFLPATAQVASPAESDPWHFTPRPTAPARLPRPGYASGKILVVEDEPGVARSTVGMLKQLGYESLHARTGQEAISLFREHADSSEPVDLVLLDMTLPGGLSGLDVAREIRKLDPEARLIATSGYFEEGGDSYPAMEGFDAILPKPYGRETLSEAVERTLLV